MSSHIVVVFGPTGSGKDTFIAALHDCLERNRQVAVEHISSIDFVRQFFGDVQHKLGLAAGMGTTGVRQGLADVKAVLDRVFDWTPRYAIQQLTRLREHASQSDVVLVYQVRELKNIIKLRKLCGSLGYGFTAVYIRRPGYEGQGGATTDIYGPETQAAIIRDLPATIVVGNYCLDSMPACARHVAERILNQ